MLGVCLLFVGIVLINNGICNFYKVDGKSLAVMNIFTGGLSLYRETIMRQEQDFCSASLIYLWQSTIFLN